jgi:hypothetical protein
LPVSEKLSGEYNMGLGLKLDRSQSHCFADYPSKLRLRPRGIAHAGQQCSFAPGLSRVENEVFSFQRRKCRSERRNRGGGSPGLHKTPGLR